MGQKINPVSLRVGINQLWDSRWAHSLKYPQYFKQDLLVRGFIEDLCTYQDLIPGKCAVWRISRLEGLSNAFKSKDIIKPYLLIYCQVFVPYKVHSSLNNWAQKQEWKTNIEKTIHHHIDDSFNYAYNIGLLVDAIYEENTPNIKRGKIKTDNELGLNNDVVKWLLNKDCAFIAQWIANSFQRRKGMKEICKTIDKCIDYIQEEQKDTKYKLNGIKITCSGRFKLTDNEKRRNKMARIKTFKKGQVPLQTLKRHINYHTATAYTPDGTSGIKVWISYEPAYVN